MIDMLRFAVIFWDPKPEIFRLPFFHWPVLWYGVLFALGFAIGFPLFVSLLTRVLGKEHKKKAIQITDRLTLYIILGTIIGARVGHFLFYEKPSIYLKDPLAIFRIWEGGLASHGGAIGIMVALALFAWRIRSIAPELTWIRLLDLISIPAALAGFFIRIGNFMNQEILGVPTDLPWGVVFGHPADGSLPIARHPVQIYEAFFYLAVFFLLWKASSSLLKKSGKLIGLFLILVFGFRFFIEYWKLEQSHLMGISHLTMGQMLSIPLVIVGIYLAFARRPAANR